MCMPSLVALTCLQSEPGRPRHLLVQVCTAIHFGSLGRRSFERGAGQRQDTMKQTTVVPSPIVWPCAYQVWLLYLACGPSQMDQGNCWSKCAQQLTFAHSAHLLGRRSFERGAGPRQDAIKRTTALPSPILCSRGWKHVADS